MRHSRRAGKRQTEFSEFMRCRQSPGRSRPRRASSTTGVILPLQMIAPPVRAPRLRLHIEYLDSRRGLSALYVAAYHAYLMYAADFATEGLRSASGALLVGTSWVLFGRAAVAVFIVLSGYCLMLPVVQSPRQRWKVTFWSFMWRRAWRILPPYYGALACSAGLILLVPALGDPSIREWHKTCFAQVRVHLCRA